MRKVYLRCRDEEGGAGREAYDHRLRNEVHEDAESEQTHQNLDHAHKERERERELCPLVRHLIDRLPLQRRRNRLARLRSARNVQCENITPN